MSRRGCRRPPSVCVVALDMHRVCIGSAPGLDWVCIGFASDGSDVCWSYFGLPSSRREDHACVSAFQRLRNSHAWLCLNCMTFLHAEGPQGYLSILSHVFPEVCLFNAFDGKSEQRKKKGQDKAAVEGHQQTSYHSLVMLMIKEWSKPLLFSLALREIEFFVALKWHQQIVKPLPQGYSASPTNSYLLALLR